MKTHLFPLLAIALLTACSTARITAVKPVQPAIGWGYQPWEDLTRKFEKAGVADLSFPAANAGIMENNALVAEASPLAVPSPAFAAMAATAAPAAVQTPNFGSPLHEGLEPVAAVQEEAVAAPAPEQANNTLKTTALQSKFQKQLKKHQYGGGGFSWTKATIIIALVAGTGLVLFLAGSWFFGLFLFILGGAALLCKWLGVLDF